MRHTTNRHLWARLFASLLFLFSSAGVMAHAQYERSDPGRRSIVTRPPEVIKIWFSEQLEPAYSTIVIKDKVGEKVTEEAATVDAEDKKLLLLNLPRLEPGKYTVFYKVLSVDGHVVDSKFKFKVKPAKKTP
ncbi:MAG: copper resistance protein CopC [Gammaproteobacteria bacterium]|nr:MAG: copper resistance protein CopC [Gammaproteobacteria bacterium]RLA24411.1 MAG: copper resistance protein CopC [Gammaproteobacteria bacterium]